MAEEHAGPDPTPREADDDGAGTDPRAGGRRLDPAARRAQLVAIGVELSRTTPLDQIAVEDIAAAAGTSKGLVFHYFPTKRELQATILRAAGDELLASLDPGRELPYDQRLRLGLEAFIDFVGSWPLPYAALVRSAGSDEGLRNALDDTRGAIAELILGALELRSPSPVLRLAVRGWIAMTEEVILQWLEDPTPDRAALVGFLERTALHVLVEAFALEGVEVDAEAAATIARVLAAASAVS